MPDLDLDAIEARMTRALKTAWYWDSYLQGEADKDLPALVAEIRRLRAEREGLKRTQTVNAARVLGPPG